MKLTLLRILLITLGLTTLNIVVMSQSSGANNSLEAKRVWELAIEAKGGRNKLQAVNNILIENYGTKYGSTVFNVFPDKVWGWSFEQKPFGKSVLMFNLDRNVAYEGLDKMPKTSILKSASYLNIGKFQLFTAQLFYLLETELIKPQAISSVPAEFNGKEIDVVRVIVPANKYLNEERVFDFSFDKTTHLPLKITEIDRKTGKSIAEGVTYSDYVTINGIQMPSKINSISAKFQINVDYDEALFETPPTVAAGRDAWKPKIKF